MLCRDHLLCSLKLIWAFFLLLPLDLAANVYGQGSAMMASVHISDTTEARQLIEKARDYFSTEQYQSSVQCLHQAEALTKSLHITPMCIMICRHMFAAYRELGKLDSALIYANMLLADAHKLKDRSAEMDAWNFRAILYSSNLELDSALNAYNNAYELAVQLQDKRSQAIHSSNMGIVFGQQRQYEKAQEYFHKAYRIGQEIQDTVLLTLGAMNIGRGFTEAEVFDSAAHYLNLAQITAASFYDSDPSMFNGVINFQALLNFYRGNYEQAEIQYEKLVDIYTENQQTVYLAETYGRLAEISLARKHYQEAIQYGLINLDLLHGLPAQETREKALLVLTQAYGYLQEFDNAFKYGEQYRQLRDSSYGEEVTRMVAEMESKYELEKKNAENIELSLEAQRQKSLARMRANIALIASLITVIILGILYFFNLKYRHKKQLNRQLEATVRDRTAKLEASNLQLKKTVEELRTFGHITSHDLKEPLRNISGFSSLLERKLGPGLDKESGEFLNYIKQNTQQMHELIQDILVYSTMEDQPASLQPVNIQQVTNKVRDSLSTLLEEKKGVVSSSGLPVIRSDEARFFTILKNLVENGLKYNHSEQPEVNITYEHKGAYHCFYVRDNGIGIAEAYHDQIFHLFKRLHNRSEFTGTGMGLAISKKLVNRLGGELSVCSSADCGSLFTIKLPVQS